jgi:hypothetical protein
LKSRISGRYAVVCALILVLGIPAVAAGFGEGRNLRLGKRNPSTNPAFGLSAETQIIADNGSYGTRQSNKGSGGGAIYGCRSTPGNEPCIRANNLKSGRAFEFAATSGKEVGRIEAKDTTAAPFTTNATGVATGLNADKVDGKDATDFAASGDLLFAAVSATGALGGHRGAASSSVVTPGTYTVKFGRDVSACSFTATTTDSPAATAVTPPTAAAKDTVTVTTGVPAAAHAFHVQVIC